MRTTSLVLGFLALALAGNCASAQQKAGKPAAREPGLYITWQTDRGNITCKLFENEAPLTVRRVVGLALGKIAYVDPATKQVVRKRLYDGLIFHRVIPQFMIDRKSTRLNSSHVRISYAVICLKQKQVEDLEITW